MSLGFVSPTKRFTTNYLILKQRFGFFFVLCGAGYGARLENPKGYHDRSKKGERQRTLDCPAVGLVFPMFLLHLGRFPGHFWSVGLGAPDNISKAVFLCVELPVSHLPSHLCDPGRSLVPVKADPASGEGVSAPWCFGIV